MTYERSRLIDQLVKAVLEQAPSERSAFLDLACNGDAELRHEVESILSRDAQASDALLPTSFEDSTKVLLPDQSVSLMGSSLGHYRIKSRIGKGGMGEVYLAEDTRLKRKVAVKLLPARFTQDSDRLRRFEQEARAASALNHPNIVTIHEIGRTDHIHYLVTEFVDGQTLHQRMASARLQLNDALEVTIQVARALVVAHEAGIVHRDIKPENLMLRRDGYVKVLDFGLAKLTERQGDPIDTQAPTAVAFSTDVGVVMGTARYMSPEQARGQRVDARSDIFSLGIVLYEMITGRLPFEGETMSDVIAAVLERDPLPLSQSLTEFPLELERIVSKALRKDREERYQTVKDLLLDLQRLKEDPSINTVRTLTSRAAAAAFISPRRLSSRARLIGAAVILVGIALLGSWLLWRTFREQPRLKIRSLAVLPFRSLNEEAKEDYLALGIATDIITKVSQSGELTVRPSSAVRKYVNQEMDALKAAQELQVDAVLDSSFLHVGDQLRVSVNLLRVADGTSLWADNFDERFTNIFAIQDRVSQQVAQHLRLKLGPAEQARLTKRHTSNPDAYNLYAKALYHSYNIGPNLETRSEATLAVDLFKKAIEFDSKYALAHAQLAYSYARIAVFLEENPGLIEEAKQELATAESLDPQLADVHAARYFIAFSQYGGWQVETAVRELRLAQQLDPNVGHWELGDLYSHIGLEAQAIVELEIALKVDPNSERIKESYVGSYFQSARPDEALEANKRFFNRGPDIRYYLEKRMTKAAEPLLNNEYQAEPSSGWTAIRRPLWLALQGKQPEAEAAIPGILEKTRRNRGYHHVTYNIARIYALGGKSQEALKWLRVTVNEGFPCYPLFARDSFLDPVRKDAAVAEFLAEMRSRWEGYQREFG